VVPLRGVPQAAEEKRVLCQNLPDPNTNGQKGRGASRSMSRPGRKHENAKKSNSLEQKSQRKRRAADSGENEPELKHLKEREKRTQDLRKNKKKGGSKRARKETQEQSERKGLSVTTTATLEHGGLTFAKGQVKKGGEQRGRLEKRRAENSEQIWQKEEGTGEDGFH